MIGFYPRVTKKAVIMQLFHCSMNMSLFVLHISASERTKSKLDDHGSQISHVTLVKITLGQEIVERIKFWVTKTGEES
jgi:hypothetical protein